MNSIANVYTAAIHENFTPLFANWESGARGELAGLSRDPGPDVLSEGEASLI